MLTAARPRQRRTDRDRRRVVGQRQGARLGSDTVIVSDEAGQFKVGLHGLCRVHAERLVHKLDTFTDEHRAAQAAVRELIYPPPAGNHRRRRPYDLTARFCPACLHLH